MLLSTSKLFHQNASNLLSVLSSEAWSKHSRGELSNKFIISTDQQILNSSVVLVILTLLTELTYGTIRNQGSQGSCGQAATAATCTVGCFGPCNIIYVILVNLLDLFIFLWVLDLTGLVPSRTYAETSEGPRFGFTTCFDFFAATFLDFSP